MRRRGGQGTGRGADAANDAGDGFWKSRPINPKTASTGKAGFGKEDAVRTGRFVLYFILVYLVASLALDAVLPTPALEAAVANNVLFLLSQGGYSGGVTGGETAVIALANGAKIEIGELCTGRMETLLIVSAIIASAGIAWRKRLLGAAVAAACAVVFNHMRIAGTALLILGSGDTAMVEFAHNVLFRAFLFVVVAGFYIGWFYWAAGSEKASPTGLRTRKITRRAG